MRVALIVIGVVVAGLGCAVAWLCHESLFTFEPTPLELPVVIAPGWTTAAAFAIGHSGEYEIQFDSEDPEDRRPPRTIENARIRWEVLAGKRRVAAGDSATYPENWYGTGERSGHEIGRFRAEAGKQYVLRVIVESGDAKLNAHRPRVNIQLNGQELSDYSNVDEARELLARGARGAAVGGLLLSAVAILARRRRRSRPTSC